MRSVATIVVLASVLATHVRAANPQQEIQHLLDAVGDSGCIFNRNGKNHSATEARDHLAMKFRRAGSRIPTAEAFIKHLATKSSWTGRPYVIRCGQESTPSAAWLTAELTDYRASASGPEES